jgi:hypothetical protein
MPKSKRQEFNEDFDTEGAFLLPGQSAAIVQQDTSRTVLICCKQTRRGG